jgi:formate--tetrahydrofolate ligase
MPYDVSSSSIGIAELAEANMPTPVNGERSSIFKKMDVDALRRIAKLDFLKIMNRLQDRPEVNILKLCITPSPLGEGSPPLRMGDEGSWGREDGSMVA